MVTAVALVAFTVNVAELFAAIDAGVALRVMTGMTERALRVTPHPARRKRDEKQMRKSVAEATREIDLKIWDGSIVCPFYILGHTSLPILHSSCCMSRNAFIGIGCRRQYRYATKAC